MTAVTGGRAGLAGRAGPAHADQAAARSPRWARPALAGLLALTALLYLAGLSRNGWANDFYAAAVQAGSKSWKAFFFGSFDASNFITVDKTPASLWVMELSARVFGLNYWSMLVPQALAGVGSVALLYGAVRRWFGAAAGLLAGAALALTPVAALMFRFNNPDALLVLLMTGAAYATVRAIESGRTRWLVLAGTLLGFGFLTKMLQAFLVLPAFGVAYLVAGPPRLRTRIWQLLAGLAAVIVAAGWWVAIVMATPAASRPYIGGSTNNSILQLALGYNGLGRLDGNETGSVGGGASGGPGGGGGGGSAFGGASGFQRLFASEMGSQISWLLPAALLAIGVLAWLGWRRRGSVAGPGGLAGAGGAAAAAGIAGGGSPGSRRTDRAGAAVLLWGGWLVVTGAVFSFMAGIIHPYYTVALAPAIAALTGIGGVLLWRARAGLAARILLAAGIAATAIWSYVLLDRSPAWYPALRYVVLIGGLAAAAVLLAERLAGHEVRSGGGRVTLAGAAAAAAIVTGLAGPAAYSIQTAATSHAGALPSAGPTVTSAFGGPGGTGGPGGGGFGRPGGTGGGFTPGGTGTQSGPGGAAGGSGTGASGTGGSSTGTGSAGTGQAGPPGAGAGSTGSGMPGSRSRPAGTSGRAGAPGGAGGAGGAGGPGGGLGGSTEVSSAITRLLKSGASNYTWVAATIGSESAAPLQLASGEPVMSIGGFNGTDIAPTLAEFRRLVAQHKIHYFVGSNAHSFGGGSGAASAITSWVAAHFKAQTVGGETVYNLTLPASG